MNTISIQSVNGTDYEIMDMPGRLQAGIATGVYTRSLVVNSKFPYCDIPIDLKTGDQLFFRMLEYKGDISNLSHIYLYDVNSSTSMGTLPSDVYGKVYTISNDMTKIRIIAQQNENTTENIVISFAMYVIGKNTFEEIRSQQIMQEIKVNVTAGSQMFVTDMPFRANPGDVICVQVEGDNHIEEMVVGYLNNGTPVNQILSFNTLTYRTGYAEIKTNVDNDTLRFYTNAARVLSSGTVTIRWINATRAGMTIPRKQYSSFNILGDSYSTLVGYTNPTTNRQWYPTNDPSTQGYDTGNNVTDLKYMWWYIVANETELFLRNNASYSGSTISYDSYGEGSTDGKTTSFIERTGDLDKGSLLFVFGGTNDDWAHAEIGEYKYSGWTEADLSYFAPAVAFLIDKLTKQYIGAQIVFIENDGLRSAYKTAIETVCDHYSVPVIKLNNISKTYNHPNIVGMRQIAEQVKAWVNGAVKLPMYMR